MTQVDQADTILGPVIDQLIVVAQQINGIGTCYPQVPEGPPADNSVMFACKHIDIQSTTNGRLTMHLEFDIIHCFRRQKLPTDLARAYAALPAWMTVLGSYKNVTLGGTVQLLDVKGADIKNVVHAKQSMLGVISSVIVRYEFFIPTT